VIFIDGSGVGGAVVDHLANRHNLPVEDIQFGSKALNATNQVRYAQRRSEMWGNINFATDRKFLSGVVSAVNPTTSIPTDHGEQL
jgi:hypothetical protein